MSKAFCLSNQILPTQYNLAKYLTQKGYCSAVYSQQASFHDQHLTLAHFNTNKLEYKHHLAELVQALPVQVMPQTYVINDDNYTKVIRYIAEYDPEAVWILKPSFMNNGEGIHIFTHYEQILRHYESHQRYGGPHVLQRYIANPHLLRDRKYTLRLFVIVTNQGQAYAYRDGYFNICCQTYTPNDWTHLTPHLTNEHFGEDDMPNIYQMPTSQCPNFGNVDHSLKSIAAYVMRAFYQDPEHANLSPPLTVQDQALGIFAFDYILDDDLNVWLLEVNHGPWFPKEEDHPLQAYLYYYLWQDLLNEFIEPLMNGQSFYGDKQHFTPLLDFI